MPEANLKPMEQVLREMGLTDNPVAETSSSLNGLQESDTRHFEPGPADVVLAGEKLPGEVMFLPMSKIRKGKYQPRRVFDQEKLALLANTI
jgi:ParB family chromosome partitioning protein